MKWREDGRSSFPNRPSLGKYSPAERFRSRWPLSSLLCAVGMACVMPFETQASVYQDAVRSLSPSFYYELNETDTAGGAADSTGHAAAAGEYNGDYDDGPMVGIPGPEEVYGGIAVPGVGGESNLAHISNNAGHITLGPGEAYGANAMTVALFIKAGQGAQGGDRVFTNNLEDPTKSFQIVIGNNGLVLAVDPSETGELAERTLYLEDNSGHDTSFLQEASGWFHVVASTEGADGAERASNLKIWVNGVDRTENLIPDVVGWGTDTGLAKIGGRRDDPTDTTTHSGGQDEVTIWLNRVLTEGEVQSLWQAALTPAGTGYVKLTDAFGTDWTAADGPDETDWNHDNGSDEWEGELGIEGGQPGGVELLEQAGTDFIRVQDALTAGGTGDNRKLMFTKTVFEEGEDPLEDGGPGVTLHVRLRLASPSQGLPLEDGPDGAWPDGGDGTHIRDGGKGGFGLDTFAGNMGFALGRADTDEALVNADGDPDSGFMLNGVNATDDPGNLFPLDDSSLIDWQEFWIQVVPEIGPDGGTHKVTVFANGSLEGNEFFVTVGGGNIGGAAEPSLYFGNSGTGSTSATDYDFIYAVTGIVDPVAAAGGSPDPTLIGWWPLTEGAGEDLNDSNGKNTVAEFVDGEWIDAADGDDVPEFLSGASVPSFDGGATYALLGEELIPVLDESTPLSIAFWTLQVGGGTGVNEIVLGNRYNLDGVDFAPREFIKFTPTQFEFHQEGVGTDNVAYPDPIPDDVWVHHAIVKDGNNFTYYRNGEESNTHENTGAYPINPQPLFIGGQQPGGEHWSGSLADIGLWGRALSAADVAKIATEGIASLSGGPAAPVVLSVSRVRSDPNGLTFQVINEVGSVVDKDSIAVTIDGAAVTTTVSDIEGGVLVTYVADPAWIPGSIHTYNFVVKDTNGNNANRSGEGQTKLKDSLMPFNTPLVGPEGEAGLWGVRYIWEAGTLNSTIDALKVIQRASDPDFEGQLFDTTSAFANLNNARPELFVDSDLYPDEVVNNGGAVDDFLVLHKGTIRISTSGLYTFGYNTDDGAGLRIFGAEFISKGGGAVIDPIQPNSLVFTGTSGNTDSHGVVNLAAGDYPIEFFWFERGGGDKGVLYFAPGEFADDADTDTWELLGGENLVGPGALPFQITHIVRVGSDVTITWQSTEGAGYTIERATPVQLAAGEFVELQDGFEGQAGDTSSFTETGVTDAEAYYRVRAE
jgi:hypothetical protein